MQSSFLFRLTRLSHSNAWPGTVSLFIFTVLKCNLFVCFTLSFPHYMFRLYIAILRCGSVDYCTAIVLKINV
jgi:hypothetical protein